MSARHSETQRACRPSRDGGPRHTPPFDSVWPSVGAMLPVSPSLPLQVGTSPAREVPGSDHARERQAGSGRRATQVPRVTRVRDQVPPSRLRSTSRQAAAGPGCRLRASSRQRGARGPVASRSPPGAWARPSCHRPGSRGSGALYCPPGGRVPPGQAPGPTAAHALRPSLPEALRLWGASRIKGRAPRLRPAC